MFPVIVEFTFIYTSTELEVGSTICLESSFMSSIYDRVQIIIYDVCSKFRSLLKCCYLQLLSYCVEFKGGCLEL